MTIPLPSQPGRIAFILACASSLVLTTQAQMKGEYPTGGLEAQAERETVRRQEDILIAEQLVVEGDRARAQDDLAAAYVAYLDALDLMGSGPAVDELRASTLKQFSSTALDYANKLVDDGQYLEAEQVAKTVLLPQYNPDYRPAMVFLSHLEQPDYFNKTVTPQFAADREEVTKLLTDAEGFYQTGRYDLAIKRYEQVLNIDRYNIAARKGMERVQNAKRDYAEESYNETRSRLLWQVAKGWELPVQRFQGGKNTYDATDAAAGRSDEITAKLNRIIIPRIDLRDTTIREAVEYLRQLSKQLDTLEADPAKKGVNIFLKLAGSTAASAEILAPPTGDPTIDAAAAVTPLANENTRVTLALNNVPLYEALRYVAELAGLKIKIGNVAVSIVPLTEETAELVTKEYRVPPTFIPTVAPTTENTGIFGSATTTDPNTQRVGSRMAAKDFLESQNIPFPPGSSATYVPAGSRLVVRNTQNNIDLIDVLVDAVVGAPPTQVEIEAKFVEINQNNLRELGFDWTLGPLQVGGTNSPIYAAGGSPIVGGGSSAVYPFVQPGANGGAIGRNLVTQGLRTGQGASPESAITINSLDALLTQAVGGISSGVAPGIFGISGVFTNPQFQLIIRALNQKKGIDLMSAPKVTTKSDSKAVINIIREFRYPTEFDPPQIPQNTVGGGSLFLGGSLSEDTLTPISTGLRTPNGVVTPTTPTAFESRNTGVTLDVTPRVAADGYTIDLELAPEVVDFDGFVNYGTPINGVRGSNFFGVTTLGVFEITPNVINQPIFTNRKVQTNVTIWDGMTVALGGLIREDVQKVEDKVPLLGDVPLVGRLFRSDVDQKIKKNLIIFVTARLIDAEGRPVRSELEAEEIVEPLGLPNTIPPPVLEVKGGYMK